MSVLSSDFHSLFLTPAFPQQVVFFSINRKTKEGERGKEVFYSKFTTVTFACGYGICLLSGRSKVRALWTATWPGMVRPVEEPSADLDAYPA